MTTAASGAEAPPPETTPRIYEIELAIEAAEREELLAKERHKSAKEKVESLVKELRRHVRGLGGGDGLPFEADGERRGGDGGGNGSGAAATPPVEGEIVDDFTRARDLGATDEHAVHAVLAKCLAQPPTKATIATWTDTDREAVANWGLALLAHEADPGSRPGSAHAEGAPPSRRGRGSGRRRSRRRWRDIERR